MVAAVVLVAPSGRTAGERRPAGFVAGLGLGVADDDPWHLARCRLGPVREVVLARGGSEVEHRWGRSGLGPNRGGRRRAGRRWGSFVGRLWRRRLGDASRPVDRRGGGGPGGGLVDDQRRLVLGRRHRDVEQLGELLRRRGRGGRVGDGGRVEPVGPVEAVEAVEAQRGVPVAVARRLADRDRWPGRRHGVGLGLGERVRLRLPEHHRRDLGRGFVRLGVRFDRAGRPTRLHRRRAWSLDVGRVGAVGKREADRRAHIGRR